MVAVHTDALAPYYTPRRRGSLLPMVRSGGGGSVADALPPISRTALDELETPPMPEAALPEAMHFLRDCLLQQVARRGLALSDHLVQESGAPAAAGGGGAGGGGVHELLALLESVLGREESAQEPAQLAEATSLLLQLLSEAPEALGPRLHAALPALQALRLATNTDDAAEAQRGLRPAASLPPAAAVRLLHGPAGSAAHATRRARGRRRRRRRRHADGRQPG